MSCAGSGALERMPPAAAARALPIERGRRVCRPRQRGFLLPEGVIYVGKPTRWANPFVGRRWGHAKCVKLHRQWLTGEIAALTLERMEFCPREVDALQRLRAWTLTNLHRLAGHDLACWCPLNSRWCHADTLLELAPLYADYERHAA